MGADSRRHATLAIRSATRQYGMRRTVYLIGYPVAVAGHVVTGCRIPAKSVMAVQVAIQRVTLNSAGRQVAETVTLMSVKGKSAMTAMTLRVTDVLTVAGSVAMGKLIAVNSAMDKLIATLGDIKISVN